MFTCLQIRTVQMKIAFKLNTDPFIKVLMRFGGSRRTQREISDVFQRKGPANADAEQLDSA